MPADLTPAAQRHLLWGWSTLLFFLLFGVALEALHGFKLGWYVDAANATRRHMFTLAHAHGALLGLVHVAYAATLQLAAVSEAAGQRWSSLCLVGATLVLPGGFLLGGLFVYGGDPGLGILLVPVGAAGLVAPVAWAVWALASRPSTG
ncbi:MAG: hypothetical protein JRG82_02675 [Deltaproteobacteria bacterium]|nr:hypothetical protein [Deltaproteobacteria bacterium]